MYIYALKLTNNKYYVGKTQHPTIRIDQHINDTGASWTKKYKPVDVLFIKPSDNMFDEDYHTKCLMQKYGIHNVRGGSYTNEYLDTNTIQFILKELRSAQDLCLYCGSKEHFIADCPKQKKDGKKSKICNKKCKRCGRNTHQSSQCYATTKINGDKIKPITCSQCHQHGHRKNHCPNQLII
ncbi:MAG TPA: GIY-YIG nuclease family protein [Candidatus Saccharimonadales bacterium]|nr:GIY-YIG nuclease family protein [Candidatus Saccharimonadales bacterium]